VAYNPDDFAQGAGILTEANDYVDAAVKILRRDLGQRVAAPSRPSMHLTNSASLMSSVKHRRSRYLNSTAPRTLISSPDNANGR